MGKNGTLHSKPSPLMEGSTVKDPPLLTDKDPDQCRHLFFIIENTKRYRCPLCGRFVNPGFEEVFKEHEHEQNNTHHATL